MSGRSSAGELADAAEQLGEGRPLVRLLRASHVALERMPAVTAFALGGVLQVGLPLIVAGGLVELALCVRCLAIRGSLARSRTRSGSPMRLRIDSWRRDRSSGSRSCGRSRQAELRYLLQTERREGSVS